MPWLSTEGSARQIGDGQTIVGSGANATWRLLSHDLAPKHFIVTKQGDKVTVGAASADAVIAVNGRQIGTSPTGLQHGDTIDAASIRFTFSKERTSGVPPATVAPAHIVEIRSGIVHPLASSSVGIGRDRSNTILIRDPTASRFHAELRREAGGWVVHPRGASGTAVNGRRVGKPERLTDGDRIMIAHLEMRFVVGPPPSDAPEPALIDDDDHDRGQRRTILQSAVIEVPRDEPAPRSHLWIFVALGLLVAGTLYLAFR